MISKSDSYQKRLFHDKWAVYRRFRTDLKLRRFAGDSFQFRRINYTLLQAGAPIHLLSYPGRSRYGSMPRFKAERVRCFSKYSNCLRRP